MKSPDLMSFLIALYGTSNVSINLPMIPFTQEIHRCSFYVDGKKLTLYYQEKGKLFIIKIFDDKLVFTLHVDNTKNLLIKMETSELHSELENMVKSLSGGENRESFFDS